MAKANMDFRLNRMYIEMCILVKSSFLTNCLLEAYIDLFKDRSFDLIGHRRGGVEVER